LCFNDRFKTIKPKHMQITKIEVQKKNKYRYSLYSNDIFLFGISENTLIKFAVSKDRDYSDNELKEIQAYEQVSRCLEQSYRFLRRRSHLQNELRRKLRQKKYLDHEIDAAIKILQEKKYLDDVIYIKQFIKDAVNIKKTGPLLILKKLLEKGAQRRHTEDILNDNYSECQQLKNAAFHAQKKRKALKDEDPPAIRQKLFAYLKQKGFETDIILSVLPDETEQFDESG